MGMYLIYVRGLSQGALLFMTLTFLKAQPQGENFGLLGGCMRSACVNH